MRMVKYTAAHLLLKSEEHCALGSLLTLRPGKLTLKLRLFQS